MLNDMKNKKILDVAYNDEKKLEEWLAMVYIFLLVYIFQDRIIITYKQCIISLLCNIQAASSV